MPQSPDTIPSTAFEGQKASFTAEKSLTYEEIIRLLQVAIRVFWRRLDYASSSSNINGSNINGVGHNYPDLHPAVAVVDLGLVPSGHKQPILIALAGHILQHGGVVLEMQDGHLVVIRSTSIIPQSFSVPEGDTSPAINFGASPSIGQVENSALTVGLPFELAQQTAGQYVEQVKNHGPKGVRVGIEIESFVYALSQLGKNNLSQLLRATPLSPKVQKELLNFMLEIDNLSDDFSLGAQLMNLAWLVFKKYDYVASQSEGEVAVVNLSAPLDYPRTPQDNHLNDTEPYVHAMNQILLRFISEIDLASVNPGVYQKLAQITQRLGYDSVESWVNEAKTLVRLFPAAGIHINLTLPHLPEGKLPLEWWRNLVLMIGSDLGAVVGFNLSTPLLLQGENGPSVLSYDARISTAALPTAIREIDRASLGRDDQATLAGIVKQVVLGEVHTLARVAPTVGRQRKTWSNPDRSSWQVELPTTTGHGVLRVRVEGSLSSVDQAQSPPMLNGNARLEITDVSSTSHLADVVAASAFSYLLMLAAMLAESYGQTPVEFFQGQSFAQLLKVEGRHRLILDYADSTARAEYQEFLNQVRDFVAYMKQEFNHESMVPLYQQIESWLDRLSQFSQAENLVEFFVKPTGHVSEVIARMMQAEYSRLLQLKQEAGIRLTPEVLFNSAIAKVIQSVRDFELAQAIEIMARIGQANQFKSQINRFALNYPGIKEYLKAYRNEHPEADYLDEVIGWLSQVQD